MLQWMWWINEYTDIYVVILIGKPTNKHWLSLFCFSLTHMSNSAFYFIRRLVLISLTCRVLHEKLTVAHSAKESFSSHGTPNSQRRSHCPQFRTAQVQCTPSCYGMPTHSGCGHHRVTITDSLCEQLRVFYELTKCNWLNIHWKGNFVNRFEEKMKHAFVMTSPRG